ncbi:MAG TPA: hypothetical protein VGE21_04060 [Flavobacteriales bacterium]
MLVVLAIHLFTALVLLPLGLLLLRLLGVRQRAPVHLVFSGYAVAVVFGIGWSFFAPVDGWAAAALLVCALAALAFDRKEWGALSRRWSERIRALGWPAWAAFVAVALVAVLKAIAPSEMVDEGGYYMPYIKWIERYPLVPGLANVEDRMGFNSAHHVVSALFSFDGVGSEGCYDLNAFLLIAAASWLVGGVEGLWRGPRVKAFDVARVACLFLLMRNMLTSATSDLPLLLLGQLVLVLFLQRAEQGRMQENDGAGLLLLLYACVAIVVKFSALPLVLPGLWILFRQWRAGIALPVLRLAVLGVGLFGPWMLRSYFLSGYLIYPLYQINLFSPDWRVPLGVIETQFHYVSEFARTNAGWDESRDLARHRGFREWFPLWYARESLQGRVFFWALVLGVLWTVGRGISALRTRRTRLDILVLLGVLLVGLALWFYRHPSFRFGWAWVLVFLAVVLFDVAQRLRLLAALRIALLVALPCTLVLNIVSSVREHGGRLSGRLVQPASAPVADIHVEAHWGYPVRITSGTQCWGTDPPCFTYFDIRTVQARGARPEDGFRSKLLRQRVPAP